MWNEYHKYLKDNGLVKPREPLVIVTGDWKFPLVEALADLHERQPEMLEGLIEVCPTDGEELSIFEPKQFRPPYMKALGDISRFLAANGYEEASKFLCHNLERGGTEHEESVYHPD